MTFGTICNIASAITFMQAASWVILGILSIIYYTVNTDKEPSSKAIILGVCIPLFGALYNIICIVELIQWLASLKIKRKVKS